MGSALSAALSGLRVNQQYLDIIGNNLANSSTIGYRGSRVTFSDLFSQVLRSGSGPTGSVGGVNPMQIGLGTQVHSISSLTTQGVLNDTGNPFDLGIQGDGFFILNDGSRSVYTRAGVFGLDQGNFLVDSGTGFRVRSVNGGNIQLPTATLLPANATQSMSLAGNLPAKVGGPVAEVLTTSAALQAGTQAQIAGSAGSTGPFNLQNTDTMQISVNGGVAVTVTFSTVTPGAATVAEVVNDINTALTAAGVTASATTAPTGEVLIETDRSGSSATLLISPTSSSPGVPALLGLSTALVAGTEAPATAATLLNDLADNVVDYQVGDIIQISGTDASGQPYTGSFTFGAANDGTTVGDLIAVVDSLITDATVSIDGLGNLVVTADSEGEASLSVSISDAAGNTGQTLFSAHGFGVTTDGAGPDTVRTSVDVFDSRGLRHTLTMTLTRVDSREWDLSMTTDNPNDVIIDDAVQGILFNEDGSFASVSGSGVGDLGIEIQFEGLTVAQDIDVGLGSSGQLNGLTQLGESGSIRVLSQDGYPAGDLNSVSIRSDGVIEGFYSNGQSQELDQLAMAVFANPGGMLRVGAGMFAESPNSGIPQVLTAGTGGAGTMISGVLESSNVDVAQEFVRLIEAQRGFQANARVIRVSDELLAELVNIV